MKIQTNYSVAKDLIGKIQPVGETYEDENRLDNLNEHIEVVKWLVRDLITVAGFKDRDERSIRMIGNTAFCFLEGLKDDIERELEDIE